jgi:hypothetical protein
MIYSKKYNTLKSNLYIIIYHYISINMADCNFCLPHKGLCLGTRNHHLLTGFNKADGASLVVDFEFQPKQINWYPNSTL